MNYFLFFCTWVDCVWINQSTLLALRSLGICVCNDTKFIDFLLSEALRILVELKSKTKLKIENFVENTQNTKLWASIAKRLIVVQQLRKTIFIYVSREIRVYHIKFIPLSIYGMLNCVRVRVYVNGVECVGAFEEPYGCLFVHTHACLKQANLFSAISFVSPATQHHLDVYLC